MGSTGRTAGPPYRVRVSAPILVTGATGTVGRPLVGLLRAAGAAVRPASRHPPDPDTVAFDFRDRSTWRTAFDGVESMFLLRPPDLTRVSRGLAPRLAFAQALGLRHVVLLSVQGAGKVPVLPHAAAERWLRRSGLSWTFVRPSYFDQNLSGVFAPDIRPRPDVRRGRCRSQRRAGSPDPIPAPRSADVCPPRSRRARPAARDGGGHRCPACHGPARAGGFETEDVAAVTGRPPTTFAEFAHRERAAWDVGRR